MSEKALVSNATLNAIGAAILEKGGTSLPLKPSEMPAAIRAISSGGSSLAGQHFDLSTEKGVTEALAKVILALGGTVDAGRNEDMLKTAPVRVASGSSVYSISIYDDTQGTGLDVRYTGELDSSSASSN